MAQADNFKAELKALMEKYNVQADLNVERNTVVFVTQGFQETKMIFSPNEDHMEIASEIIS